ncbi:patatin-like phospholipase family protein [Ferrimonas senticii]|uniref:patatin-like phospholipase family protein n=1 Tax=Ferrimonas senticii TaxID=394566 RepID=UPI00040679F0|nr:patatin-like phospholipase family protein [Ferrimonas senticii]
MTKEIKIGIALGSGAAKGWAHIGVLRGLQKLGMAPHFVAGCSIGAFVGAAYAADKLDELEQWVRGFSGWDVLGLMDLSWRRGGIIDGEKVFEQAGKAIGVSSIADLKRPYMAVATDLYSGQEVWLEQGSLKQIIGASCAIPGFIQPKQVGNRWLVDGAVVNPVPVSACRAMGADLVIAVDLHGDVRQHNSAPIRLELTDAEDNQAEATPLEPELQQPLTPPRDYSEPEHSHGFADLLMSGKHWVDRITERFSDDGADEQAPEPQKPNALAVMHQSMAILEQRHKRARMMGDPPEVVIAPQVGDIVTMEFQRAEEAIAAGEAAVERIAHILEAEIARLQRR